MPTLTKAKIADAVALSFGCQRNQSARIIESLLDLVKGSLAAGEDLLVSGFGKFEVKKKRPRIGRNPATGEAMTLEGRRVVVFRCSAKLREYINGRAS
jgi:integration host factor subunit alpha